MSDGETIKAFVLKAVKDANERTLRYAQAALLLRATLKRLAIIDGVSGLLKQGALAETAWLEEG